MRAALTLNIKICTYSYVSLYSYFVFFSIFYFFYIFAKLLSFVCESCNSPALPFFIAHLPDTACVLPAYKTRQSPFLQPYYTHARAHAHTHCSYYSPSVRNNTQVIADISCHSLAAARNCASGATLLVCSVQYQLKLSILINILIFLIRNVICFI